MVSEFGLPWLPQLREASLPDDNLEFSDIEFFCKFALNSSDLQRVSSLLKSKNMSVRGLIQRLDVKILADENMPNFEAIVEGTAPRYQMKISCEILNFRSGESLEIPNLKSETGEEPVFLVIVFSEFSFPGHESVTQGPQSSERDFGGESVEISRAVNLIRKAKTLSPYVVIATVPSHNLSELGHLGKSSTNSRAAKVTQFNNWVHQSARTEGAAVLDLDSLANIVGFENWCDRRLRSIAGYQLSPRAYPLVADHMIRLFSAMLGKTRRVLVVDLDNTLWGGVLGDDGLDQLVIGGGDPIGEAYLDFQRYIRALKARGIILAISSKNDEDKVREVLETHPEMLLRTSDFAVISANWEDKAENIRQISRKLNLALTSFVFVDDNPVERERVRNALPEVLVIEMPSDPVDYPHHVQSSGCFETVSITKEDRLRALDYAAGMERENLMQSALSVDDFLRSLNTVVEVSQFQKRDRERIHQLVHKSNQFNLTTIRYSAVELVAIEEDSDSIGLSFRLSDRLSDSGIIAVVVLRQRSREDLDIETWLMSCRILSRGVEACILDKIMSIAARNNYLRIYGHYRPTSKNALVEDHYKKLGFTLLEQMASGETTWIREVSGYENRSQFIVVRGI